MYMLYKERIQSHVNEYLSHITLHLVSRETRLLCYFTSIFLLL